MQGAAASHRLDVPRDAGTGGFELEGPDKSPPARYLRALGLRLGLRVQGLGFRVSGSGFGVQGLWFRV